MLWSLIRILHASYVQIDTEMAEKYANQRYVASLHWKICCRMGLVTLTYDLETGMRVASKVGNFHFKFGYTRPLGSQVICYGCNGQIDGQTKATLTAPSLWAVA